MLSPRTAAASDPGAPRGRRTEALRRARVGRAAGGGAALTVGALLSLGVAASGIALVASVGGCSRETSDPRAPVARVDTYTGTRGQIVQVPDAGTPSSSLIIHHEEVPDFRDASGAEIGMREMSMPFEIGRGVDLPALTVGDVVQFDWTVTYLADNRAEGPGRITALIRLPADTRLEFAGAEAVDPAAHDGAGDGSGDGTE